jgi:hypothetical protein
MLIDHGVSAEELSKQGASPLYVAVSTVAWIYVSSRPCVIVNVMPLTHLCCTQSQEGCPNVVKLLLDSGADIERRCA